jgi:ABC-type polysaccharide/polyol phosphate transport system ATPase subunit
MLDVEIVEEGSAMAHIQFENVCLEYPIRENQTVTFKEFVLKRLLRRDGWKGVRSIQALRNLSFEIQDGERIGIIGLNGAGKSTLLRTIGGIYPIASGSRLVDGSICALFDIGFGLDMDATGWKNIHLRAYLQGETPWSITPKLKEIADFTELGHFLDLPMRCYSTGMIMRLAFAVATARCPEILLIDEVFATGDLVFQKKAEARMRDFLHKARIVVMVGHQLNFLQEFCTRVIWLQKGEVRAFGPTHDIIDAYMQEANRLKQAAAAKAA